MKMITFYVNESGFKLLQSGEKGLGNTVKYGDTIIEVSLPIENVTILFEESDNQEYGSIVKF